MIPVDGIAWAMALGVLGISLMLLAGGFVALKLAFNLWKEE